jgi:Zn-dependent peptidase ImmA (M78 family)
VIKNSLPSKISRLAEAIALGFEEIITPLESIILVEELDLHYDSYGVNEFDGMTLYLDGYFSIHINTDNNNFSDNGRGRFTLAHELGHYILDSHRVGLQLGLLHSHPSYLNDKNKNNVIEREADYFASCLLMPKEKFEREVFRRRFDATLIQELAKKFNVSFSACALRFTEIGNHPIMVIYSENGIVKWSKCSANFPFYVILGWPNIPVNTIAGEYFRGLNPSSLFKTEEVWAIDWFDKVPSWNTTRKFFEHCIPYKNSALSVIWEK